MSTSNMFSVSKRFSAQLQKCFINKKALTTSCILPMHFEEDFAAHNIPITNIQRTLLSIGSSLMCLLDPRRADMIATMGEITGINAALYIKDQMLLSDEGRRILSNKPRINSTTVDLSRLKNLPDNTIGKKYYNFLENNNVTPDSRDMVRFVDDVELAYIIQRYREIHDLVHTVLGMPTNMLGEVTVKWVEAIQMKLPMCVLGGLFGAVRLAPKQRKNYTQYYLPWAISTGMNSNFIMNIYFEERWDQPFDNLLNELNIRPLIIP